MNQLKIGKFITQKRKEKNLTQEQLAEKLSVSNKTVSKWETGKCMPDYSIIKNLCDELEITIAELIDGGVQEKNTYSYDEEQIMNLLKRTQDLERTKKTIYGFLLIIMGIALQALANNIEGSNIKDFVSGTLLGISIVQLLIGVYICGKGVSGK